MQCPKCDGVIHPKIIEVPHGKVEIDRCEKCAGLWFDGSETEALKGEWMTEFVDSGDPVVGKKYNRIRDIDCPKCGKRMEKLKDAKQKHIEYEACPDHGVFMDAGEFTDLKHETLMDLFRGVAAAFRRRSSG